MVKTSKTSKIVFTVLCVAALIYGCSDSGTEPVENPTLPTIAIDDQSVIEGNTALFNVSLNAPGDESVVFTYTTSDVTATAPADYIAASGTDTIPAGTVSKAILVATVDDSSVESQEVFSIAISSIKGATLTDSEGLGTIVDNDVAGVSFENDVKSILLTCAAANLCHGVGANPRGGLLMDPLTRNTLVNATGTNTRFVVADSHVVHIGDSRNSTLYTKTTDSLVPFGSRMPPTIRPYLTSQEQQTIKDWIDQGALDN